ncbi:fumarylacetoacetate hydrolase family protein [Halorubraceae archaeon YAN]|nr:fumarylacetoacetate hydrolase family protein [Halorubraceae archaeon YAN]
MTAHLRFATDVTGRRLVGDADGFIPLSAAAPDCDDIVTAAQQAASIDIDAAPAAKMPADELQFGIPFTPGKLWGIGLNYADHAADLDETRPAEPASFMKPKTALAPPGGPIRLPEQSDRVTAEAELAIVIGRTCTDVSVAEFADVVAGFVPVIDMTAEDILQRNPRFLTRSKSFDSFLVVGPWMTAPATTDTLEEMNVETVINDEVVAKNGLDAMHFSPPELLSFHSSVMTLNPGDVISTGTPGAGVIRSGDVVEARVHGVGTLSAGVK